MTLRITVEEESKTALLKLEGRLSGPWTSEFERVWHSLAESLGQKKLCVDLRGVTHMNADGQKILTEIHSTTDAEILADTPMTQYFADQARRRSKNETKGDE